MDNSLSSLSDKATGLPPASDRAAAGTSRGLTAGWWPEVQDNTPVPWWVHLLLVSVLLGIDVLIYHNIRDTPKVAMAVRLDKVWFVRNAVLDVLAAALFYLNWMVLFPRTLSHGRVGVYLVAGITSAAVFSLLRIAASNLIYQLMNGEYPGGDPYTWSLFIGMLISGLLTMVASSGVRMTIDYLQGQRNRRELERNRSELERQHLL
ncbi:MAG TPA: hypothetical protein VF630_15740, partial [Hymenobacter sp.]